MSELQFNNNRSGSIAEELFSNIGELCPCCMLQPAETSYSCEHDICLKYMQDCETDNRDIHILEYKSNLINEANIKRLVLFGLGCLPNLYQDKLDKISPKKVEIVSGKKYRLA